MGRYSSISAHELICVCAESNDSAAWEEFVSRFQRAITFSVLRAAHLWTNAARQVVDDLVQETYLKLCADKCRLLREFGVAHPEAIPGYIKTVAVNVVHDHFRALHSQKRGAGQAPESLDAVDASAGSAHPGSAETTERGILLKEIDNCLRLCSSGSDWERDRMIFWLYYRQGMTAKAIASLPGIGLTDKGVESVLGRLTRLVRERLVDLKAGTAPEEKGFSATESY